MMPVTQPAPSGETGALQLLLMVLTDSAERAAYRAQQADGGCDRTGACAEGTGRACCAHRPSGGGAVTTAGRQRVLDGALRLFSERGYADTSMRDIAHLLGLQNGSLYSHYRSKDELLEQALAPLLDGVEDLLRLDHPALKTRDWLAAYASHLAAHVPAVKLAGADLAVARHTTVGQRLADSNARTRRLLMRHDHIDEAEAAARLGRLWWPLICLPTALTEAELHALI